MVYDQVVHDRTGYAARMASPSQLSVRLEDQLCFALYAATRAMTASYRPLLDALGVTYPQYLVLLVLWERRSASIRELGDALAMDYGTLSPIVKRLAAAGLVERRRRAGDERVVDVTLTDSGAALERKARAVPAEVLRGAQLDLAEVRELRGKLVELRRSLASDDR